MEEQTHRRRRRNAEQMAPESQAKEECAAEHSMPQEEYAAPAALQTEPDAVHHRRRRSVSPAQEETQTGDVFWHPESELLEHPKKEAVAPKKKSSFRLISTVDKAVCRIGDDLLLLIKWLGVGTVQLLSLIAGGAKKAGAYISQHLSEKHEGAAPAAGHEGKRTSHSSKREIQHPQEPITLQPTRPQDYQGMSSRRAAPQRHAAGTPRKKASAAYYAVMAALICVALVSGYMVFSTLWRSVSTKRLSQSLSQRYSALEQQAETTPLPEFTPVPTALPEEQTQMVESDKLNALDEPEKTPAPTATPKMPEVVKSTKFHQVGGDALPEMEALYRDNRDLVGWLRMEGILDLPVVYRDNKYYLTHDFYKNKSASGTLFLDENHPFRENAQNLLLHGHNMKDGTMFGRLVQYETNLQFLKNNPFIQYSTLWNKEQYVIFAVLDVSLDVKSKEFFNYFTHHTFTSDAQFERYVRSLQNRSVFSIPVSVQPSDALLTLSTCLDEDRLVIVARRIRPGESKSELRHQVQLAARQ